MTSILQSIPKKPELRKFRKVIKARRRKEDFIRRERLGITTQPNIPKEKVTPHQQEYKVGFFRRILNWVKRKWRRFINRFSTS